MGVFVEMFDLGFVKAYNLSVVGVVVEL